VTRSGWGRFTTRWAQRRGPPTRILVPVRPDSADGRSAAGEPPSLHPARGLRGRCHLRDEQRVRVRLPPRQHEVRGRGLRPAELNYAIVDEVDNILIDEARTPLIISGPSEESTDKYYVIDRIIPRLKRAPPSRPGSCTRSRRPRPATTSWTRRPRRRADRDGRPDRGEAPGSEEPLRSRQHRPRPPRPAGLARPHPLQAGRGLRREGGRGHHRGRVHRPPDGGAAVERRAAPGGGGEGKVKIQQENQTLASITIQNYFRMYAKLSGMTGTADTEAEEFAKIYNLDVVVIPTNRPLGRVNHNDVVFKSQREKLNAVADEIAELHKIGRPSWWARPPSRSRKR